MKHVETLNELIDAAKAIAGSDYQLAKMLGVPRGHVSAWRHGKRTATPEDQALIAGIAGLDAAAWLARATCAKHEGTAKGERLLEVLGKASLVTIATVVSSGANAAQLFSLSTGFSLWEWLVSCSTMYRSVKLFPPKGITATLPV